MVSVASVLTLAATAMAAAPVGKYFDNYIFVIMENNDIADVLRSPEYNAYIKAGVEFTDYHGTTHPSQPNYWSTIAQSTFRGIKVSNVSDNDSADWGQVIDGDNGDDVFDITGVTTIADSLEAAGLSWGIYSENYPGNATNCFLGQGYGTENYPGVDADHQGKTNRLYKRKHNPFVSFTQISGNTARCGAHVFSEKDWAAAVKADKFPDYSFIVPNQVDDAHDFNANTDRTNLTKTDEGIEWSAKWLANFLADVNKSAYLNSRRTLIHVTFDEDDSAYDLNDSTDPAVQATCKDLVNNCPGDKTNNQVYGVLLGSAVSCYTGTTIDGKFDHNSIVATLNDNWGLPSLGNSDSYSAAVWPLKNCPVQHQYQAPAATNLYSAGVKPIAAAAAAVAAALLI
ncbi:hypothetical protein HDU79_003423 [Rhizoclosmatium sp. JEL0117]|nr:hypothetical protein HDU79_003423 [Rhizoclosmatium sp. JEL0117]